MSRQAMFPSPVPAEHHSHTKITSPTPPPIIVNKAMGSFARREVVTPIINSRTSPPAQYQARPVPVCSVKRASHKACQKVNYLIGQYQMPKTLKKTIRNVFNFSLFPRQQTIGFPNTTSSASSTHSTPVTLRQFD